MSDKMIIELSNTQVQSIKEEIKTLNLENSDKINIALSEYDLEFLRTCIMLNEKFEGGTYSLEFLAMKRKLEIIDLKMAQFKANLKATLIEFYNIIHDTDIPVKG